MNLRKGYFYETLAKKRSYNDALMTCIEETVTKLLESDTSEKKPGILLGKVQGGKTRTFLGVIALAFDNGYDMVIILTKGTKPLTEQTLKRVHDDFEEFEEENKVQIHDIMLFPENMVSYELSQKLIVVAKKETNNLKRILEALTKTYPDDLKNKKVLIIDDEADFASISFHKVKESGQIEQGKIAQQIDQIRQVVDRSDFLQVTATPYSLYLQSDTEEPTDPPIRPTLPKRPAFTVLVPIHDDYIGGDYYFIASQESGSAASYVYEEVTPEELEILRAKKTIRRADRRSFKIEEVFTSPSTKVLRNAIMNFIVGGCIRRIQQKNIGQKEENYSFVIHTEQSRTSHDWQEQIVNRLNEELISIAKNNAVLFKDLVSTSYDELRPSIDLSGISPPELRDVLEGASQAILGGMLVIEKVNSDKDVKALLDNKGQLKLRTPLNIFIGGQILDRGITIKNMIGFFYGRNPKRFQQDTVLQHSRMYGARSREDLAITRFYTTRWIYEIMLRIHEFDNALREAFLKEAQENGIYFIRKDDSERLVPCSPNKIMLSNITTLRPHKRLLPIGFQTGYKTNIKANVENLDKEILGLKKQHSAHFTISIDEALNLLDKIKTTLAFEEPGYAWDIRAHKASLEYLSKNSVSRSEGGKVWVVVRTGSNISRRKMDGRFSDDPDGGRGEVARAVATNLAENIPALILVRVNGDEGAGWKGSAFWWPIIIAPKNTDTTVFASETLACS